MTPRERMIIAMRNGAPDRVPVAPDTSNMIPCRLTGKPFWDIYLYQDPPLWQAYIECVRHFGFDGWLPGVPITFDWQMPPPGAPVPREAIVHRTPDRIITRHHWTEDGHERWSPNCTVYYIADPPTGNVPPAKIGLSADPPRDYEDVTPRTHYPGVSAFLAAREMMGDDGVVAPAVGLPGLGLDAESQYQWADDPASVLERCERDHAWLVRYAQSALELRPDFLLIGISGHMIANPEPIFRKLSLPTLQAITRLCKDADVPSQIHCCGPERSLVRIAAEESDLTSINPLEIPPMGDCNLAEIKRLYGSRLSLMGNLHTTDVMLRGTPDTVREASRQAIEDAAEGGGFILSTGDQCGRDTPDENIRAMMEAASEFGVY